MIASVSKLFRWIGSWDVMAILYSALGGLLLMLVAWWSGGLRRLHWWARMRRSVRAYRRALRADCSSLIVIGRRQAFPIRGVFVELDVAPSELMGESKEGRVPPACYVLVGGPGAGKSTTMKKAVLDDLSCSSQSMPFYVRLREYLGTAPIEVFLAEKLGGFGVREPSRAVTTLLQAPDCLCVLDGLDEVRPHLYPKVCDRINEFLAKYFSSGGRGRLIVTCRKEAYRSVPLNLPAVFEVRPLSDQQMMRFARTWPLGFPQGKSPETFWHELVSTESVLELARTPLLLIGALMQYTESNLGVADERVKYLGRVAQWLVADWARAQGHPPDPWRDAYPRILAKLALEMQRNQISECTRDRVLDLLKGWLPSVGLPGELADDFLQGLMTKTGILVQNLPGALVFAQFSLQEYFASIEAVGNLGYRGLADKACGTWWREVIPMAVAQEKDPTQCLEALFTQSPVTAARALAECPTPSLHLQERAIRATLAAIDDGDAAAGPAVVSLLRKVSGAHQELLCAELERRLMPQGSPTSLAVGLILATAGTAAATEALARHPEAWAECLAKAGYLSSAFEDLLVRWMAEGTDEQSRSAAEILCRRLSQDRRDQLEELLGRLPASRANHLASLLLQDPLGVQRLYYPENWRDLTARISACVPYLDEPPEWVASMVRESRGLMVEERLGLAGAAIFIPRRRARVSPTGVARLLSMAAVCDGHRGSLFCWFASGALMFSLVCQPGLAKFVQAACVGLMLLAAAYPVRLPPWAFFWYPGIPGRVLWGSRFPGFPPLLAASIAIAGILLAWTFAYPGGFAVSSSGRPWPLLGLALCISFVGFVVRIGSSDIRDRLLLNAPWTLAEAAVVTIALVWSVVLVIALALGPRAVGCVRVVGICAAALTGIISAFLLVARSKVRRGGRHFRRWLQTHAERT